MRYTEINGKKLSDLSLGTVQLGMRYGIANSHGQPSIAESFALLDAATSRGVTSFDTARGYGTSEDVLGAYFKQADCAPFLTTKFGFNDNEDRDDAAVSTDVVRCVETSLEHLGVKKVDCMLLHNGKHMFTHEKALMDAFDKILAKGYAGMVGMSVYEPDEVEYFVKNPLLSAIQIPMSLFDQKLIRGGQLDMLAESGKTVFVRSVFLQGLCFLDPENPRIPALKPYIRPYLLKLRELADAEKIDVAQFCLSFIRDLPGVTSLVLGAETTAQVEQNVAYIDGPALSDGARAEVMDAFRDFPFEVIMQVLRDNYGK